jgi:flagellar protein FliS
MSSGHYAAYANVQTTTADPVNVIFLLYDGAGRFLRQAEVGLERGDGAAFAYKLSRAHAIIAELSSSLNLEAGGEVAANLSRLYDFMLRHLTEGLCQKSAVHLSRVRAMLAELRDGFAGAVQTAQAPSHAAA